ncbi:histidine kinase [Gammaproteobacteria bacterium]
MNIRHRIMLLVVMTFIAIASIGGYAIYQSRKNATEVRMVTEGVVPSALASADLVSQLKDVQLAAMTFLFSPDQSLAEQTRDKLLAKEALLKQSVDQQAKVANNSAQSGLCAQTQESLANYFEAINGTIKVKLEGQTEMATAIFYASVTEYQREIEQIVDTLRIEKNRTKDSAILALNEGLVATTTTISAVTVVTILILTTLGILLYRQITGPIGRMQAMMSEIATSQDFSHRLPVKRQDEIGRSIMAFNVMIEKIQESSAQLKQKNIDIQAMLQNIPQGILTITEGNRVHPEYSAYLETIFETQDIAGGNLMDLVFSNTHLGTDSLSQVEAAVCACIGEDVMNFEFNQHVLVGEIEKRMADGRLKILNLDWSPITDDTGTIVRLMLCVRDVTELRKLTAETHKQKRELEIIGEILGVSQEKFNDFILGAIEFIDENERIIRQHPRADAEAIAHLFRNMHTIKGNARTYGLHHLTNILHEAEQLYQELRKPRPDIVWYQPTLLDELASVREAVEHYANVNDMTLGRKGPGRRGSVERYLMVEKERIRETLHRLETVNTTDLHALIAVRDEVRRILRLLGTEQLGEALAGVLESLPSLAQELGKEVPTVKIQDNGYVVHNQASGLLKNVFVHLIRNAVDHGLEIPEVRYSQGKPAAGTIYLHMHVTTGMLQIALSDDGRGMALGRIRQIAIDKGFITAEDVLSDEEIAALIFRPGFSTAEKVTEVSGRGVGMDAVQNFVKREQGKIEIRFTDQAVGADFRQFQIVVCLPDTLAVKADGGYAYYPDSIHQPDFGLAVHAENSIEDVKSKGAGHAPIRLVSHHADTVVRQNA